MAIVTIRGLRTLAREQGAVFGFCLNRGFKTSSKDDPLGGERTAKERRRRRRSENRRLREVADEFQDAAPFLHKEASSDKETGHSTASESGDGMDRMWGRLLKNSRSASEARRIKRSWERWTATTSQQTTSQQEEETWQERARRATEEKHSQSNAWQNYQSSSGFSGYEEDFFTGFQTSSSSSGDFYESFYYHTPGGSSQRTGSSFSNNSGSSFGNNSNSSNSGGGTGASFIRPILPLRARTSLNVLGLETGCLPTMEVLKKAFLRCAMDHHPDRHAGDASAVAVAEGKFKDVQAAFSMLQEMTSPLPRTS